MGCDMMNRQMDKSRQYSKTCHLTHEDHCAVWLETESQNFQLKWRQTVEWSWGVHTPACTGGDNARLAKIPCNFAHIGVMRIFLAPNILPAFSAYCWLIDVSMVFVYRAGTAGSTMNIIHLIVLCSITVLHHVKVTKQCLKPCFYGKVVIHLPFSWLTHLSLTWGPHVFIYLFI